MCNSTKYWKNRFLFIPWYLIYYCLIYNYVIKFLSFEYNYTYIQIIVFSVYKEKLCYTDIQLCYRIEESNAIISFKGHMISINIIIWFLLLLFVPSAYDFYKK